MADKPYCPKTLAERWGCSAEKIRRMYRDGELAGFELGKLIRIPASEVARYECQNIPSPSTEENTPSPSETVNVAAESRLARITAARPKLSPVLSGTGFTPQKVNG
ncbi:MAG: excisionase family DNA-binding protein [Armatimonadia bacterium]